MEAELAARRQSPSPLPLHLKRFLATVDEQGRISMQEISPKTYMIQFGNLPKLLADPGWGPLKADRTIFERISRIAAARAVVGANYAAELYRDDLERYQTEQDCGEMPSIKKN